MGRKVNPRRQPATRADVERAKKQAEDTAVDIALALFFTVLRDKHGFSVEDLQNVWRDIEALSDSVERGYVNITDLLHALKTEAGIVLIP